MGRINLLSPTIYIATLFFRFVKRFRKARLMTDDSNEAFPPVEDRSGKPWTRKEMDYLASALHSGETYGAIAKVLKRTGEEVDAKADFMGM
jgi:hypothetical protein